MDFTFTVLALVALLISLSTHEFCHALAGFLLGDETARRAGRLTLNPVSHMDPIGTVLVPIIGAISGFPLIGWAKPVPFNPYNLKYRKWGPTIVALAGPGSNFLLALIFVFMLKMVIVAGLSPSNLLVIFLSLLVTINVVLGIFNFLPIPPLDGSKLAHALLDKPQHRHVLHFLETKGPLILMLVIFLDLSSSRSILGGVFNAAIGFVFGLAGIR